ncbi:MAG TPA: trypsin-like peptidase domain-containing protein [Terriglobia bacterium]|nr:trypsin-like peptidase domain-containing protein [Terriglobia bacterium]
MRKTPSVRYWAAGIIAFTLGIGVLIGSLITRGVHAGRALPYAPDAKPLVDPSPSALSDSFAAIAAKVGPAVVNINTKSTIHFAGNGIGPSEMGPNGRLFRHFFQFGPEGAPRQLRQESLGSGVILDKNGYILTNDHVVVQDDGEPVDSIEVYLRGQDQFRHGYRARVVGSDPWTDLAVLKINARETLPVAHLGNSSAMRVGDWVLAIGSPFDLRDTVTAGIISAKGREIPDDGMQGEFKHFLQTDAAINPGNSGGPLVNLGGQVIGINTAIATTQDSYNGVGFAIPSDTVRRIYNDIVTTGRVRRGAIGVHFVNEENDSLLRSFGASHGVVIQSVEQGSPAGRAGLKMGDVITDIDSKPIRSGDGLLTVISSTTPGTTVHVGFVRSGKPLSCDVVVGDWNKIAPSEGGSAPAPVQHQTKPSADSGVLGLSVRDLSADAAQEISKQLQLGHAEGVAVASVAAGSFADDLGIQRSDIILSINHEELHSMNDFNRVQRRLKSGQDVLFLIAQRNGAGFSTEFLADRLP